MHHERVSTNYPWLPHNIDPVNNPIPEEYKDMVIQPLGNIQDVYERYMAGCIDYWETNNNTTRRNICNDNERGRIEMSTNQPRSMKNFTKMGFAKIRAPDHVFTLLKEFWDKNHMKESSESWSPGNIYT
jgi:prolyl 4-hydroxylase